MLWRLRRSTRAVGLLALLVFIAPGVIMDCQDLSALSGAGMACCNSTTEGSGLRGACCSMGRELPASERPSSTAASASSSSRSLLTAALPVALAAPASAPVLGTSDTSGTGSPPVRLYIRFGVIRR